MNSLLGSNTILNNISQIPSKVTVFKKYHTKSNSFNENKASILPKIDNNTLIVDNFNLFWKISHNKIDTKLGNKLLHSNSRLQQI